MKKDETVIWIDTEMRRIKNTSIRTQQFIKGKIYFSIDPTSQKQLGILERQKAEYLKSRT
jgi:hypothetical protein